MPDIPYQFIFIKIEFCKKRKKSTRLRQEKAQRCPPLWETVEIIRFRISPANWSNWLSLRLPPVDPDSQGDRGKPMEWNRPYYEVLRSYISRSIIIWHNGTNYNVTLQIFDKMKYWLSWIQYGCNSKLSIGQGKVIWRKSRQQEGNVRNSRISLLPPDQEWSLRGGIIHGAAQ